MTAVLNTIGVYIALLIVFRIAGRRSLGNITNFDVVVLLIISESVQQALIRDDYSFTNALIVFVTLVTLDVGLSLLRLQFRQIDAYIQGVPTILIEEGQCRTEAMRRARVDLADIMESARLKHGLERLDQIRFAILETNGEISIIPSK
ncbi:DUF421 domain-containing protein [Pedomonas mirosovicensis]|uniref:DUF421 domain-containing protein n=1 Tax=Pedomonas mirosovicensis TaxID=2908641 RepID=UPI0021691ADB|nr:YetF domain-containing protein [Pedomonas mirosovicensis]MCH8685835.1 DUF421 domain-containing protein [Pedomonas mirosovicensis]